MTRDTHNPLGGSIEGDRVLVGEAASDLLQAQSFNHPLGGLHQGMVGQAAAMICPWRSAGVLTEPRSGVRTTCGSPAGAPSKAEPVFDGFSGGSGVPLLR